MQGEAPASAEPLGRRPSAVEQRRMLQSTVGAQSVSERDDRVLSATALTNNSITQRPASFGAGLTSLNSVIQPSASCVSFNRALHPSPSMDSPLVPASFGAARSFAQPTVPSSSVRAAPSPPDPPAASRPDSPSLIISNKCGIVPASPLSTPPPASSCAQAALVRLLRAEMKPPSPLPTTPSLPRVPPWTFPHAASVLALVHICARLSPTQLVPTAVCAATAADLYDACALAAHVLARADDDEPLRLRETCAMLISAANANACLPLREQDSSDIVADRGDAPPWLVDACPQLYGVPSGAVVSIHAQQLARCAQRPHALEQQCSPVSRSSAAQDQCTYGIGMSHSACTRHVQRALRLAGGGDPHPAQAASQRL